MDLSVEAISGAMLISRFSVCAFPDVHRFLFPKKRWKRDLSGTAVRGSDEAN
jgi:hypothetical protein